MGENDLDFDTMLADFESEWEDTEGEESTDVGTEGEQEVEETDDSQQEQEQEQEQEETPNPNNADEEKRNRAFADLRRQADENRKYAEFINRLAQDSGVSPDDILSRYQERQLEEKAQQTGVPVEFLQRQNNTEQELSELRQQLFNERLDGQLKSVIAKYGENEPLIRGTFDYMAQLGIDPTRQAVDFEKMYRAANLDSIIQQEVQNARQKDLANKKTRQSSASIGNGTSVSPSNGELSDEEVQAYLDKFDIKI